MKIFKKNEMNIEDEQLSELLKEVYPDDNSLISPERTAEIINIIRSVSAPELIDSNLTTLLKETYGIESALTYSGNRTENIMLAIKSASRDEAFLGDADLTQKLKDSYEDDPALIPAPGRTHRIMQNISTVVWNPLANFQRQIAIITVSLSAALIMFFVQFQNYNKIEPAYNTAVIPGIPEKHNKIPDYIVVPIKNKEFKSKIVKPVVVKNVLPDKHRNENTRRLEKVNQKKIIEYPVNAINPANIARIESSNQRIAAALYSSGNIAHASGDYNSAYNAYLTSYELSPSPEALLASGQALVEDVKVTINNEVDWL